MAQIPNYTVKPSTGLNFSRSVFDWKKTHTTNLLTGYITPMGCIRVLPGDTIPLNFGFVLQSAPLLGPTVDNIYIDVCAFWVPDRLVFADYNQWLGESDTLAFTLNRSVEIPKLLDVRLSVDIIGSTIKYSKGYQAEHFLGPHYGIRVDYLASGNVPNESRFKKGVSLLPARGYDAIYNDWWRNQNITAPVLFSKGPSGNIDIGNYQLGYGKIKKAMMIRNMFNLARPAPAIDSVDFGQFPVMAGASHGINLGTEMSLSNITDGSIIIGPHSLGVSATGHFGLDGASSYSYTASAVPNNLYADLSTLTVNSLYYNIMLQKYYNIASLGTRSVEFFKNFFGIDRSDIAHDRTQLLCQKRYTVNISRVVATANSTNDEGNIDPVGTQGAFSVTSVGDHFFDFTATEHGYIHYMVVIRTQPSLATGIDRHLSESDLLSTYLPVFDHIGDDAIEQIELLDPSKLTVSSSDYIFGFQESWYQYRFAPVNDVVGITAPGEALEYWTLARDMSDIFTSVGAIGEDFILQGFHEFDRMLVLPVAYGSSNVDEEGEPYYSDRYQWIIQFAIAGKVARTMSKNSTPLQFGRL